MWTRVLAVIFLIAVGVLIALLFAGGVHAKGIRAFGAGEYDAAATAFERAVARNDHPYESHLFLARIAGIRGALPGKRIRPGSFAILRQAHQFEPVLAQYSHGGNELAQVSRLLHIAGGTKLISAANVSFQQRRRHHDHRNRAQRLILLDRREELEATLAGHLEIEQNQVGVYRPGPAWSLPAQTTHRFPPIGRTAHLGSETVPDDRQLHQPGVAGLVLDNQEASGL